MVKHLVGTIREGLWAATTHEDVIFCLLVCYLFALKEDMKTVIAWPIVPPMFALKATPTPHSPLFAEAAITPPQRLPCLIKH